MANCYGQHDLCDVCDGMRHDPDTGWGGFTDHFAGKHFNNDAEQEEHYRQARAQGKTGQKEEGEDE